MVQEQSLQIHRVADAMKQLSLAVKDNQARVRVKVKVRHLSLAVEETQALPSPNPEATPVKA